ncbi:hypothetical protein [Streptomyces litmocidini]|uniref:Uncharacterized protein n=1 Tax=Streptomyces litmocidini TaxID=67318 RepID=A0ABW7UGW9_9ACTN
MGGPADAWPEDVFAGGRMDAALADVTRNTGTSVGLACLLPPGDHMLRLVLRSGVSPEVAAPWLRIPVAAPVPVADVTCDGRAVDQAGTSMEYASLSSMRCLVEKPESRDPARSFRAPARVARAHFSV